jgi:Immunity protein 8
MRARVHHLHSPDADLDSFVPADPGHVGILVQIMAGPADGPGTESFDVIVCTPSWLGDEARRSGPTIGRHHLIVDRFDTDQIRTYLTKVVEAEQGTSWETLAERIGRIGKWEFEDYAERT